MDNYANVLRPKVQTVTELKFRNETCCKKEEPEEHRKYVCNDTLEISSLSHMGCALRKLANETRTTKYIKCNLFLLSIETEQILSYRCENKVEKCEGRHKSKKPVKIVNKCNQKICILKKMIDSFKSCWDQLMQKCPLWHSVTHKNYHIAYGLTGRTVNFIYVEVCSHKHLLISCSSSLDLHLLKR